MSNNVVHYILEYLIIISIIKYLTYICKLIFNQSVFLHSLISVGNNLGN